MNKTAQLTDLQLDLPASSSDNDAATTIAQLKAASESLRRLNEALSLIGETDAELRAAPIGEAPAEAGTGALTTKLPPPPAPPRRP